MSTSEVLDGVIVLALGLLGGTLDLASRHPRRIGRLFLLRPARKYLLLNSASAVVAYLIALILGVHFKTNDRFWLVVTSGFTGLATLRGLTGLARPVQSVQTIQTAALEELDSSLTNETATDRDALADRLTWDQHKEALGMACLLYSNRDTDPERLRMVEQIARAGQGGPPELCMFALVNALCSEFGDDAVKSSVDRVLKITLGAQPPAR